MDRRKYRLCLVLLLVCIVAGTAAFYVWKEKGLNVPKDGVLVWESEYGENGGRAV